MARGDLKQVRGDLKQMAAQVLDLLDPELSRDGFEILDVRVFQGGGRFQVRIYVDLYPDGGITLDECTRAGRTVNMLMEEADLFSGQYVLEVSSPGIRRPLRLPRHFEAAVGQKVDLKLKPAGSRKRLRGLLEAFDGETLQIQPRSGFAADELGSAANELGSAADETGAEDRPEDGSLRQVKLADLYEANLDPEFDAKALIHAARRQKKEERRTQRSMRKKKKSRPKALKDGVNNDLGGENRSSNEKPSNEES